MTFPTTAKLAGTFTLEGAPGTSLDTRQINFSQAGYYNCKLEFVDVITSTEMTSSSYESYKSIFNKFNSLMYKNILHSVSNGEEMQCRIINSIDLSNNEVNAESGYIPYSLNAYFTRGFNGTTPTAQYGYNSGYYANVFMYNNGTIFTPINASLSGTITSFQTDRIVLNFTTHGYGSGAYGYVFDLLNLNLRLSLNSPLTYADMLLVKGGGDYTSVKAKINDKFSGKIIKVFIEATQEYEEMLIIDVYQIIVTDENQTCPNDSGYMPNRIDFNVTRAYNGTTSLGNSPSVSYININKPGGLSFAGSQINAYVDGNQDVTEYLDETVNVTEEYNNSSGLIELLSETLLLQDSQQIISTNIIQGFFQEYLLLETNLEMFTYKNVLVLFNDLLVLHENYNNNIDVKVLYDDIIRFLDDYNAVNLNDFLLFLNEVIKFNDSDLVIFNVGKIIELLLSEYFIISESSIMSKEVFSKHQEFLEFNNELSTERSSLLSFSENLNFVNLLETNKITQQNFEEILLANCVLMLDGEMYECYSLFMENGSITRYDNYNFNSYCKFNNEYYATSKDMLVKLFNNEETTETDFKASFKTGVVNASNDEDLTSQNNNLRNKQKFLSFSTFTLTSKGQILFNIINDKKEKFTYNLVYKNVDGKIEQSFGTKVRGNYFELELTTNDDLELQDYIIYPTILSKYNK